QRLIRGTAERLRQTGKERQRQDVPDPDVTEEDQSRQDERRGHLDVLRSKQESSAIVAICDYAADQREQQDRQLTEKIVEPKEKRRLGEIEDQPALRDLLHPGADGRGKGAEPQDAEVAITERGKRALKEWLSRRRCGCRVCLRLGPGRRFDRCRQELPI